ncbi:MAG: glycosyltransferase [Elusimicrobia bacterium]|nr:glycosyltransferase [Elusimicrobiota bacterium]
MKIGIIIPSYNEDDNLRELILDIEAQNTGADICVVDDSPGYSAAEALKSLGLKNLKVILRRRKGGRGSAVLEGINFFIKTDHRIIIEMDADFSHPPSQIAGLISESLKKNIDLLIASRYLEGSVIRGWPLWRRFFSRAANIMEGYVLGVPVKDYTNGFRVYSRRAAETISLTCGNSNGGFIALSEILVNLYYRNYRIAEVPMLFTNRLRGQSTVGCKEICCALFGLLKVWRIKNKLLKKTASRKSAG